MDVIVTHVNADFDGLGGMVGAGRLYPGALLVLPGGEGPGVRDFLSLHRELVETRVPADVDPGAITRVVVVDTSHRRRLGPAADWLDLPNVEVHLYDHHTGAPGDIAASLARVERRGAVSSLLAEALRDRAVTPTPVEATALLLGIYEDTGSLAYAGTTPEDLDAAAWLLRAGADLDVVVEFTRRSLGPEQRRLLRDLLEAMEIRDVHGVRVIVAAAPPGPYVEEAAGLVHRLLDVEDAAAAFILAPMGESLYVIGRSRHSAVNAGAALRELGGGGHTRAASAVLKRTTAAEAAARLEAALGRHISPERTAREIMSYPVRTIAPGDTVTEARSRMIRYGHSGLVVLDGGRLAGVVTRRDVDKARHHRLGHAPVRAFMTTDVHTVAPETPLSDLERILIAEGIGRLPVVRDGEVAGIVTRTDVLKALHGARYLAGAEPPAEEPVVRLLRQGLPARVQRLLEQVGRVAEQVPCRAYVVGGFVRDVLLGVRNLDVDVLAEPDGAALAAAVASETGGELKTEARFGTAKVRLPDGFGLDFATARTETYAHPGALPDVEPSSVVDDLRRRDFTFNAMAIALLPEEFGELLDPFGGRADLERRRVRVLHNLSFLEDPTRILRAVTFEERFHLRMDAHTERLARGAIADGALGRISPERLRAEFYRTFREPRPLGALLRLQELGVLQWVRPGLSLDCALLRGVGGALEWWKDAGGEPVKPGPVYMAALLAPLGAGEAARVAAERFRLPAPDLRKLEAAAGAAAAPADYLPPGAGPAALTRRLRPLPGEALLLLRTRAAGSGGDVFLDRFVRQWRQTRLEITGEDLKRLGYGAGPALGAALSRTLDARLDGLVSGREEELAFAAAVLEEEDPPDVTA